MHPLRVWNLCYRTMKKGFRFRLDKRLVVAHQSRASLGGDFCSLRNYVIGEGIKSRKRTQYPQVVARTYRLIPLQKVASLILSLATLPAAWRQALSLKEMPLVHRLAFPPLYSSFQGLCIGCLAQGNPGGG